ncbi:MAG: hypothetical protein ABIP93_14980 [Gemmatimonadaceae bacterium]
MMLLRATVAGISAAIIQCTAGLTQAPPPIVPLVAAVSDRFGATATTIAVAGSGVDQLTTAIVHSKLPTLTGTIQQSTEIVELTGDLKGRVLYHVTTVIDTVRGTLVNTGDQVFSGTVAGSAPVMVHDDRFRFEVNLATGTEVGRVYLLDRIAGPTVRCTLDVVGTGRNAQGNPTFTYGGECVFAGGSH